MSEALAVFQRARFWLNRGALENMEPIEATDAVFQPPKFQPFWPAFWNMPRMLTTRATFQRPRSRLKLGL